MKYFKKVVIHILILTVLLSFNTAFIRNIQQAAKITHLLEGEDTTELLRQQQISGELCDLAAEYETQSEFSRYAYMAAMILTGNTDQPGLEEYLKLLYQYCPQKIQDVVNLESSIWEDLRYFPVPLPEPGELHTSYENSWMFARNFGGERGHEGTDIMASLNERGRYPIISMTDGVVEKIGWLTLGGYRIGIRSPSGGYYYYAHLYDYAKDFKEGDTVKAGELLGFMGDSGYGKEGTIGQFAVHLHVGVYVNDKDGGEMSLNPYWMLKWLEPQRIYFREQQAG